MRDTGNPGGAKRDRDRKAGSERNEFRGAQTTVDTSRKTPANAPTSIMATHFPAERDQRPESIEPPAGNFRARRFSSPCASA